MSNVTEIIVDKKELEGKDKMSLIQKVQYLSTFYDFKDDAILSAFNPKNNSEANLLCALIYLCVNSDNNNGGYRLVVKDGNNQTVYCTKRKNSNDELEGDKCLTDTNFEISKGVHECLLPIVCEVVEIFKKAKDINDIKEIFNPEWLKDFSETKEDNVKPELVSLHDGECLFPYFIMKCKVNNKQKSSTFEIGSKEISEMIDGKELSCQMVDNTMVSLKYVNGKFDLSYNNSGKEVGNKPFTLDEKIISDKEMTKIKKGEVIDTVEKINTIKNSFAELPIFEYRSSFLYASQLKNCKDGDIIKDGSVKYKVVSALNGITSVECIFQNKVVKYITFTY